MIRFGWFRLLVRLAGIVLVGMSIPSVAQAFASLIYIGLDVSSNTSGLSWYLVGLAPSILQLALGLYLLFGGKWLMQHCLRDIDTICPACAYDLSGVTSDTCPECGFRFRVPATTEPAKNPPAP